MASDTQSPTATPLRRARRTSAPRTVLAVAVLGTFMAFVDATIVNIAVPNIAQDFAKPLSSVSWVLNAYNIVFAAFLVGGGQLADLLGRRRVFSFAVALFTLASGLCAAAPTLGLLVAARVLQAAGAAVLVPSSLAIVLEAHAERDRTHAVALWSAVAALAAGIGPPLGGLLITASSWRLVFLVNIPVGIAAFLLARRVIVESRAPGRRRVPDLLGALVLSAAIATLVLGVVKGQEWGWTNARTLSSFAAALLLGSWFLLRSTRRRVPVIDLSLLRVRAFALSNGATLVMASGFYAYTLCNVLFLTSVWRYSILTAGLALTPGPFTAMAVAGPASRLVERVGHRRVLVPGALIWAAGMAYFATQLGVHPDFLGEWLPGMLILGVGAGLTFPTLSGAAVRSVPGPRFAVATSLNSVARQLGAALGVAVLVAILGTPSPTDALHAFRHGWEFAGACFVTGATICLALRVVRLGEATHAEGATAALHAHATRELETSGNQLPTLTESAGEHAEIPPQTIAHFLRNVPVFASLSEAMLERLAALAQEVLLPRGEWLFRAGDEPDGVYAMRVGHLEVIDADGERLNTLTRGAVLGELALLNGSRRSASVRALRDSQLLRIAKPDFDTLLGEEPELARSLTRVLSTQLQASRAIPPARRSRPVTIALRALHPSVPLLELADELSAELCSWGNVAVLYPQPELPENADPPASPQEPPSPADATARYAPIVDRCERDHDQVLLVCGGASHTHAWDSFCLSRADRALAIASGQTTPVETATTHLAPAGDVRAKTDTADGFAALGGCDLVGYGVPLGSGAMMEWVERFSPATLFTIPAGEGCRAGVSRMARRLSERSTGVVLSGGGARAFAHLGVLDVLLDAGLQVDRVGGVSMGAFVGGLLAREYDAAAMDACCYEEWVRRNPINDYTLPRSSLIKGQKAEAMLERVFGEERVEELPRSFYCASVELRASRLVIHRDGPMTVAVGASIALPLIGPPKRAGERFLVDGSLLDNLPLAPMSSLGEGPVLAIDIKGGEERPQSPQLVSPVGETNHPNATDPHAEYPSARGRRPRRLPALPETMSRIALLSSANTDESARRYADLTIPVRVPGVGLLEFHQIDEAREAGRRAGVAALESAPDWLLGAAGRRSLAGQRTVVRV